MSLWDKALDFLVLTIGQSTFDSWRNRNNVDNYLFELRAALPKAELLIERAECWRLPKYNPIDKHLSLLKDSVYEAKSIVDELKYQSLKKKVEENFAGSQSYPKWIENWMSDFPTTVKRVIDRLNIVYNEMKEICDSRGIPENPNQFSQNARPNTSKFLASKVYGRDKVLNEVIRLIMGIPNSKSRKRKREKEASVSYSEIGESSSRMDKKQNVSVLSIVGRGGIGKTTLAQMVSNNKTVRSYFDLIMWVCVSDNFNKERLTKEMIESATKKECNVNNLYALQEVLQMALNSKKFLLVLDDVWSKDWQDLLAPMEGASEGSLVLVTTRSPKCVKISGASIRSRGVIKLEGLEEHFYWDFFMSCAFDSVAESNNINPDLKAIGKEICKRLKGSPLAAITIGGTLKHNSGVEHWTNIKNSKMWELQEEHDILPVLQLSYQYLPTNLKKCFSFCSLYPKDFKFTQSELTKFWMMQGFIESLDNDKEARTLADTYFVELLRRGFFQALAHETYVIHDLMHDVCLSITKDECFCLENGHPEQKVSLDIRHTSVFGKKISLKEQKELCKYEKLLSLKVGPYSRCSTGIETWCNVFKHIRSLSLARCKIKKLPKNIGNLKHLLFLDISGTYVKTLPESFCNLYSLQYLNMMGCSRIECFPERFYKLVNLQLFYLDVEMVSLVERFENIVKAIWLYNLSLYLSNNKKIKILKNLVQISGYLYINNLQYVPSKEAAQKAQLSNKTFIDRLGLTWPMNDVIGNDGEDDTEVLDGLCPNHNLKELEISGYRGRNLSPSWLNEEFLPNLTEVEFWNCFKVSTISHLPHFITKLVIHRLYQLENLQNLLEPNHLPALNHIELVRCDNLELLSVELFGGFATLEKLIIDGCPNLRSQNAMVLPPSVKNLILAHCGDLEESIPSCLQNLTSLETLVVCGCDHLVSIPAEVTSNLKSLSKLDLIDCKMLQSLGGHQFLECLQEVHILRCPKLDVTRGRDINKNIPKALQLDHQKLNKIRKFDEIANNSEAPQLRKGDGVRESDGFRGSAISLNNNILRLPTGHMVDQVSIFGRDVDKMEVINFLLSDKEKSFSVISIVGKGGIGKTTIAELVYKDLSDSRCFDLFGWVCVSEVFDVRRLIKATVESVSKINYGVSALSPLQEELAEIVKGKTILLVLDDVWNEDQSLWELFRVSFKEASMVRILVTTRTKNVADVMQSTACFTPTDLPESLCWQLFEYYAFCGTSDIVPTHLIYIGKEIMRKCGGLPLAVKLIASLLRHETDVEGWREILKSDLWESNPSNYIFPALQISYAHLPAHLKPCFLFCSLYPKNYILEKMKLIELWISHGYIESKGKRITEIGGEYYKELKERSILDDFSSQSSECCKLHNLMHDLAQINSENENYSVEINQPLDIQKGNVPREVYHLYARGFSGYVNQILQQNQQNLKGLRTLSMDLRGCSSELEHQYCIKNRAAVDLNLKQSENYEECSGEVAICNLIEFQALTVLELKGYKLTKIPDSIFKLKHLVYLCITSSHLKMLQLSLGLLYNLHTLILDCFSLEYLPESIGNLANLQYLYIRSGRVKKLPKSLCSLSSLLRLVIRIDDLEEVPLDIQNLCNLHALTIRSNRIQELPNTIGCLSSLEELNLLSLDGSFDDLPDGKLDYVPHGFVNFLAIKTMAAWLGVKTINWLKDMKDLEGKLSIGGLKNTSNLEDAQLANLKNKCKLETLDLCWDPGYYILPYDAKSELRLSLITEAYKGGLVCADDVVSFPLLECLQPHPNLKKLLVRWYPSAAVPNWMRDPSSFRSIQEVLLECCVNIQSLPFENFHTLKHLTIVACSSIRVLQLEQVSYQLEKLQIVSCDSLELITGLGDLDMLASLEIYSCQALKSLKMGGKQMVLSTGTFGDSSHGKLHTGQQSIVSLGRLEIENCELLCVLPDGLIPPGPCYVCIRGCGFPDLERNLTSAINEIR